MAGAAASDGENILALGDQLFVFALRPCARGLYKNGTEKKQSAHGTSGWRSHDVSD